MARLEIEHIIPLAKGGTDDETNLWLACPICNGHKSDKTEAADPETGHSTLAIPHRVARHGAWGNKCQQELNDVGGAGRHRLIPAGPGSNNVQPAPQRGSYAGSPKPKGPKSS
jgi:hypothetical protein